MSKAKLRHAVAAFALIMTLADLLAHNKGFIGLDLLTVATLIAGRYLAPRAWRWGFSAMLILSVAIAALATFQLAYMPRPHGLFISANFLGSYAVLHLFLALVRRGRFWWAFAGCNAVTLCLSQSRGAFLACAAGMAVLVARQPLRATTIISAAAGGALAYIGLTEWQGRPAFLDDPRLGLWRIGWSGVRQKLLLGWGQGGFSLTGGFAHFYNSALDCLLAAGVIGLAAAAWMLFAALREANKADERRALLALITAWLVQGLFIYASAETVIPLYAVMGYLIALERRNIPDVAGRISDREPFLHSRMGVGGTN